MPPYIADVREPVSKTRKLIKLLVILCGLALATIVAGYFYNYLGLQFGGSQSRPVGTIYLSLSPEGSSHSRMYRFNLDDQTLTQHLLTDEDVPNLSATVMPNDPTTVIFVGLIPDHDMGLHGAELHALPTQIYSFNHVTGDTRQLSFSTTTYYKREPITSGGFSEIVYAARTDADTSDENFLNPDQWSIYRLDPQSGEEEVVTRGAHPLVSPDGKFLLALRSDGLYVVNILTKASQRVWVFNDRNASIRMQLDLSKQGDKLAWSYAEDGALAIFNITSWSPFTMELAKSFKGFRSFWPVFSPDGKYLAIEEADYIDKPEPRLVIIDLSTGEKQKVLDLNGFVQEKMFVDDWVY